MFIQLFFLLKQYGVPVSITELIDLNRALKEGLVFADREALYRLIRLCMVKDERYFDRFDRAMTAYFDGIDSLDINDILSQLKFIPEEWLQLELLEKNLTPEERAALDKVDSVEELMRQLQERLREQRQRHQGGNRMIGTAGTSPFGAYGDNPAGVRIGGPGRKRSAVKVWEQRQFQNLDDQQQLGVRQMQVALRRLRRFARQGAAEELDIDSTIHQTARQGMLDIQMRPERRNRVKVLMLLDIGGSMDVHIQMCERLFSAARGEFKTLEFFYFHNCVYDYVWKDNLRKTSSRLDTAELLRTYGRDYRLILVGDASMAPHELTNPGGAGEFVNEEPGIVWLKRLQMHFDKIAWLNPEKQSYWHYTPTIDAIRTVFEQRMYPLTLQGIEEATRHLTR